MTNAPTPSAVAESLRLSPYPLLAVDVDDLAILGANEAAYDLLGRTPNSLEGVPTSDVVSTSDRPAAEASLKLLASGAIDGYRALRHFHNPGGAEFRANAWVRLTNLDGNRVALATLEPETTAHPWALFQSNVRIALAVTDHDWTIERVSSDIQTILGLGPDKYKGSSLLGLLQPVDVQNFMQAVGRVAADGGGATLRMGLRAGNDRWQEVCCLVVTMCQHTPPRLGLAFTLPPDSDVELPSERHRELVIRGSDLLGGMGQLRMCRPSESLSTRQWEILMRLVRGERVRDIADALYLSPSTVRNHLTAIYRRFGVHSQAGLLAKLLQAPH